MMVPISRYRLLRWYLTVVCVFQTGPAVASTHRWQKPCANEPSASLRPAPPPRLPFSRNGWHQTQATVHEPECCDNALLSCRGGSQKDRTVTGAVALIVRGTPNRKGPTVDANGCEPSNEPQKANTSELGGTVKSSLTLQASEVSDTSNWRSVLSKLVFSADENEDADRVFILLLNHDKPIGVIRHVERRLAGNSSALIEAVSSISGTVVVVASDSDDPFNHWGGPNDSSLPMNAVSQSILSGAKRQQLVQQTVDDGQPSSPPLHVVYLVRTPPHPDAASRLVKEQIREWGIARWAVSQPLSKFSQEIIGDLRLQTLPDSPTDNDFWTHVLFGSCHVGDRYNMLHSAALRSLYSDSTTFTRLLQRVYQSLALQSGSKATAETLTVEWLGQDTVPMNNVQKLKHTSRKRASSQCDADAEVPDIEAVFQAARTKLASLESRLEAFWLEKGSNDSDTVRPRGNVNQQLPLLEFGDAANEILDGANSQLRPLSEDARKPLLMKLAGELKVLFEQQLASLRDYYGQRYERVLEETIEGRNGKGRDGVIKDLEERHRIWREAAAHMTEGFRAAAQHAVPGLCRPGAMLRDADFDYVVALQGLLQDMVDATQLREDDETMAMELDGDDSSDGTDNANPKNSKRKGIFSRLTRRRANEPKRWYEKLAARALMLGVNYLQGWLAWQGVKRAAIERDRNMPKFPLF